MNANGKPKWPKWLIDRLGVDYFGNVVQVDLGDRATDAEMEHVGRLGRLRVFGASRAGVTDAGLARLRGLPSLENVHLSYSSRISGASLAHLKALPKLGHIHLAQVRVTDADLAHLEGMAALEWLNLSFTQVTDAGLAHLEGLSSLTQLQLELTRVTSAGLVHLQGLRASRTVARLDRG